MTWTTRFARSTAVTALTVALATGTLLGVAAVAAAPAAAAGTATMRVSLHRFDHRLLVDINRARRHHGERPLQVAPGTTDVAHGWTCRLARSRLLVHNLRLGAALDRHGSGRWTTYAENVGYVSARAGAGALFRAYMASPEHRANILDRSMRYVGLWSKRGGHRRYNTIDFVGSGRDAYRSSYGAQRTRC
jgi:uncharacterized protein YkwD